MKAPLRRAAIPFEQLFNPRAVAIVGINESPYGGAFFLRCLKSSEFPNPIYLVNPKLAGTTIMGCDVYSSILEVPDDPPTDVLIVAVRAEITPEIVELAGQKGIPFVHIFSSGYAEVGREDLEVALLEKAREYGVRIIGPNCLGAYNPRAKTSLAEDMSPLPGDVAFISQSGNLASMLGINGPSRGYFFSKIVSIGNQIDVDLLDFFQYFCYDPETRIISGYIENIKRDGAQLVSLLQSITPTKPVVIWKGGVAESGQAAVMSHTGGLAGNYQLWRAMTAQTGAILVDTMQELSEMNQALSMTPIPETSGVAVMTVGGGISVEITDACERNGLTVPPLSEEVQEIIRQFIPDVNTNVRNPLDLGFTGMVPDTYGRVIAALAGEPQISSIIMIRDPERFPIYARSFNLPSVDEYIDVFVEGVASAKSPSKLVASVPLILADGEQTRTAIARFTQKLLERQIISFDNIAAAAKCIYRLWNYGDYLRRHGARDS